MPFFGSHEYQVKSISGGNIIKDVDTKSGIVTGYFSAFGNVDHHNDVMVKGCYAKTIKERGVDGTDQIHHLLMHNWEKPIGKLLTLKEDDFGLYFESKLSKNTTAGKDAIGMYQDKLLKEHSVGFSTVKNEPVDEANHIKEVFLYEGSSVLLGANSQTPFTGFKTLAGKTQLEVINQIEALEKALYSGSFSDDTFLQMEEGLKSLRKSLAIEPRKSTHKKEPVNLISIFKTSLKL